MTLELDQTFVSELKEGQLGIIPMVHLDLVNDPIYITGLTHTIDWAGQTWEPVGALGSISNITQDAKGGLNDLTLEFKGTTAEIIQPAKDADYIGRSGRVYLAVIDHNHNFTSEPQLFFAGPIAAMPMRGGKNPSITVTIESRAIHLRNTTPRYRTDIEHQRDHPGDNWYKFKKASMTKTIYWGLKAPSGGYVGGAGGGGGRGGFGDSRHFNFH